MIMFSNRMLWVAGVCALAGAVQGQVATTGTVTTLAVTTATVSTTSATQAATKPAAATKGTIALIGERPLNVDKAKGKKHVDIVPLATAALGSSIVDLTTGGLTLDEMLKDIQPVMNAKPTVVVLFAGAADEKSATSDDAQQYALKAMATSLMRNGSRVYVVPSSPALSTLTAANLRIGATSAKASFIETGGEIAGTPYEEALAAIRKAEENPQPIETPAAVVQKTATPVPAPASQVTPSSAAAAAVTPSQTTLPPLGETTGTARVETAKDKKEPSRSGGVFSSPTPARGDDLANQSVGGENEKPKAKDEPTTVTGRQTVSKRGSEAEPAIINMRPLPALKNFEPKRPVMRKDTDRKAPDVAR